MQIHFFASFFCFKYWWNAPKSAKRHVCYGQFRSYCRPSWGMTWCQSLAPLILLQSFQGGKEDVAGKFSFSKLTTIARPMTPISSWLQDRIRVRTHFALFQMFGHIVLFGAMAGNTFTRLCPYASMYTVYCTVCTVYCTMCILFTV